MLEKIYVPAFVVVMVLVIAMFVLAACATPVVSIKQSDGEAYGVTRFVDKEAGVVCWKYYLGGAGGGISCLPLKDTKLGDK